MFCTEPNVTVNNSEGAIFLAVIFQIFQGTNCLNQYFEKVLNRVCERMNAQCKNTLKKHLLQVFLAALFYNASATINYLEREQLSKQVIVDIFRLKKSFKSTYEQKCFVIGITNMLTVFDAPDNIKDPSTISRLLQEVLQMLDQVKKKEGKEALKRANKQIHQEDSDDDSDSDVDDSSSDDDDDEELGNAEEVKGGDEPTHGANGKADGRNRKSGEEEMSDEEQPNSQNANLDDLDSSEDEYEN